MNIGWPEGIWFAIVAINLLVALANDGKPKEGNVNLAASMLGAACAFGLLYWGGFFA